MKKKLISHRGNITGPNMMSENSPSYILQALQLGFDVEIDVWFENDKFYLGHDAPTYETDLNFLFTPNLWCHAKNVDVLPKLLANNIHCFWHQEDDVTLTSKGYIWTYPGKLLVENSIAVVFGKDTYDFTKCAGICSDYIISLENFI